MAVPSYARPIHAATGAPAPPEWAGYWTFVTAAILVGFVLFITKKGTLSTWIGFFSWATPSNEAPATTGTGSTLSLYNFFTGHWLTK